MITESTHSVSSYCEGEVCGPCLRSVHKTGATHKISEELMPDEEQARHPLSQYVCCTHFKMLMGHHNDNCGRSR